MPRDLHVFYNMVMVTPGKNRSKNIFIEYEFNLWIFSLFIIKEIMVYSVENLIFNVCSAIRCALISDDALESP